MDSDQSVTWKHPDIADLIRVRQERLKGIKFDNQYENPMIGKSRIELTNGDVFYGMILDMDSEQLRLNTWYAGDLQILKVMLQSISPGGSKAPVYTGPNQLDEWIHSGGEWQMKEGRFIGIGTIGRDLG